MWHDVVAMQVAHDDSIVAGEHAVRSAGSQVREKVCPLRPIVGVDEGVGIAREVARMVLPVSIYSSAYVTVNARAMMNFLSLRRKAEDSQYPSYPQREIEMVAEIYEEKWAELMPITHAAFVAAGRVAP